MAEKDVRTLSDQEKTIALFQFIKELNKLKQKVVLNVADYPWHLSISDLPDTSEYITVAYRDRVTEEDESASDVLLSVRKPEFEKCPAPSELFSDWLLPGWDDYHMEAMIMLEKTFAADASGITESSNEIAYIERFEDSKERIEAYYSWLSLRSEWVARQKVIEKPYRLFKDLYQLYFELQREAETEELIVANGMLCDSKDDKIAHPVLSRRVKLTYDEQENVISVHDTDAPSELYSAMFQKMDGINPINSLNDDLLANDYHPLDRIDTPAFLKALVRQISSDSIFSENGIPKGWDRQNRFLLYLSPCYIVRNRLDGTPKAIEKCRIVKHVGQRTHEGKARKAAS